MTDTQRFRLAGAGSRKASGASQGCSGVWKFPGRAPGRSGRAGKLCERLGRTLNVDGRIELRIGSMNVGSLRGRGDEVVETVGRRKLDVCLLQETRRRGAQDPAGSRNQVRRWSVAGCVYKFFWSGNPEGTYGVGILLAESWADKVFEVQRPSDCIILLKLIIGSTVYSIVNVYAPQSGRISAVKDRFYDQLNAVIAKIPNSEELVIGGDWNGHVGKSADGFHQIHGGFGFGERNAEGGRILDFAVAHDLVIGNTLFEKRDSHLITFDSGENQTQIDYFLIRRRLRKYIRDIKVIPGEECLKQHRLLVCIFQVAAQAKVRRRFTPRLRTWKLRDPACTADFESKFAEKCASGLLADSATQSPEEIWSHLKNGLNSAAEEVCGYTKNHQWRKETWWWNSRVDEAVKEKRRCYKVYTKLKRQKLYNEAFASAKAEYDSAKKLAKQIIWHAKHDASKTQFADVKPNSTKIHRIAKQMRRQNQDICGDMPVRNQQGELCLDESARLQAWVEHYKGLLNVEFPWDEEALPDAPPVEDCALGITDKMVSVALNKMKCGKAAGPSGIITEMLKAAGPKGIEFLRELIIAVVKHGKIPEDWEMSFILNLYKGKGDALNTGNYRGLKLTEHVMKVMEHLIGNLIKELINIDEMQYAFVQGQGTTDAIFIVRQLQEKYLNKFDSNNKNITLYFAFVDLEKAFDRVPRKVLWWAMRTLGIPESIVRVVQAMYNNARSKVRVGSKCSEEFEVGVGVHQGSVLSPLLFIIVLEALSRNFRTGVPWELLFADDLVIVDDSLERLIERVLEWKNGLESKGLRVNMTKTKFMASGLDLDVLHESGKFPCAVCRTGVGASSIQCTKCNFWVHKKCSGLKTIKSTSDYACPRCKGAKDVRPLDGRPFEEVQVGDSTLEAVDRFCYLGDMLSSGGGCMAAAIARCRCAWGKFRENLPLLTARALPFKIRGRLFTSVVRNSLLHATETWPMSTEVLYRLCRNDRAMIRWICGVKPSDDPSMADLHNKLGLCDLKEAIRVRRLRWYGHVMRHDEKQISKVRSLPTPGKRRQSRPRMTWEECIKRDLEGSQLKQISALDRDLWNESLCKGPLAPTPSLTGSAPQPTGARPRVVGMRTRSSIKKKPDLID